MNSIDAGDLSEESERSIRQSKFLAVDIETSGLDWGKDSIGLIAIMTEHRKPVLLRPNQFQPQRFISVLEDPKIQKIFHHAMFDLRFICNKWSCTANHVACTKIMAKLLAPTESSSLKDLLCRHFGVNLNKHEQQSDWMTESLSESQLNYALSDVRHLFDLYQCLQGLLHEAGLMNLAELALQHVPTRVILDLRRYPDIYSY